MGKTLYSVGCVGAVTDGGVRDVNGLLTIPFPAYCRGVTIHHAALRFRGMYEPIEIGRIVVRTGDVLHADAEGVIKIPPSCLDILAARRTDPTPAEKRRVMAEALAKYGFAGH